MARIRTLDDLISDVRIEADIVGALARHPDVNLTRYINQGATALRDLLIEIRGRSFLRAEPELLTGDGTSLFDLPEGFYQLISLRDNAIGEMLRAFSADDEGELRLAGTGGYGGTRYEVQGLTIELLPAPSVGRTFTLDYIATHTDLVDGDDELEGYDGWEDYVVAYAVRCVAERDDLDGVYARADKKMGEMAARIRKLAPKRDQFRPERVRNVRNRGYVR